MKQSYLLLLIVPLFFFCSEAQNPMVVNNYTTVIQELETIYVTDTTSAPKHLEVSTTLLSYGTANDKLQLVVTGGDKRWSISNAPTWLSFTQTSGQDKAHVDVTLNRASLTPGDHENAFTVADGDTNIEVRATAKVTVIDSTNIWYSLPVSGVVGLPDYHVKILEETFTTSETGLFRMKALQSDCSYEQLDESFFILIREKGTVVYFSCQNPNLNDADTGFGVRNVYISVDLDRKYTGPRNVDIGTYFLAKDVEYEIVLIHAKKVEVAIRNQHPEWIHQNFSDAQSVKLGCVYFKKNE